MVEEIPSMKGNTLKKIIAFGIVTVFMITAGLYFLKKIYIKAFEYIQTV